MIDAQTQTAIVQGVLYGISILAIGAMVLLVMLGLVALIPKLRRSMGRTTPPPSRIRNTPMTKR